MRAGAAQVLHAQADRRERILDLVRHLSSHLAPGEHALRARELGHVIEREHGPSPAESRQAPLLFSGRPRTKSSGPNVLTRFPHVKPGMLPAGYVLTSAAPA